MAAIVAGETSCAILMTLTCCVDRNASTAATFASVRNAPGVTPGSRVSRSDTKLKVFARAAEAEANNTTTDVATIQFLNILPSSRSASILLFVRARIGLHGGERKICGSRKFFAGRALPIPDNRHNRTDHKA